MKRLLPPVLLLATAALAVAAPERTLVIGCAPDAPPSIRACVDRLAGAADTHATLRVLKGDATLRAGPLDASDTKALEYANIVLVGLPADPLIRHASHHAADFSGDRSVYVFGFGAFQGDLGYAESGPNPWLHSDRVPSLPFEAELIVLTGTTERGVELAVDAFLKARLVNGLVAEPGSWKRTETTLLDRDPAEDVAVLAAGLPAASEGWTLLGVTDCGADVARGILEATGREPVRVRLAKYTRPGELDGEGRDNAVAGYLNGLDRCAYGDAVLVADFATEDEAKDAGDKLAKNGRINDSRKPDVQKRDYASIRAVSVKTEGKSVFLSTLP